jgi:hypothetical protein
MHRTISSGWVIGGLLLGALLLLPLRAEAANYSMISKGSFEIGIDNMLLLRNQSVTPDPDAAPDDSTSSFNLTYTGGLTPRYFVINNLAIGLDLDLLVEKASTTTKVGGNETTSERSDTGFLGLLKVNYYLSLGEDFFFLPGIGAGWAFGTRSVPVAGTSDQKKESSINGFAAKVELGFAYYAGEHVNIKAGPSLLLRLATEKPKDSDVDKAEPTSTTIDAGFFVGVAYTF